MTQAPKSFHLPLAMILLPIGGILIIAAKFGFSFGTQSGGGILLTWLFGILIWLVGCTHLAIANKLNAAFGLLGFLFIVGLLALFWFAKKQPEFERSAARRRAQNPKKEYRGDPDSLY